MVTFAAHSAHAGFESRSAPGLAAVRSHCVDTLLVEVAHVRALRALVYIYTLTRWKERESVRQVGGHQRLPEKSVPTLARVALRGDGEAGGADASEAAHDVVAGVRAGRLQGALVLI